MSAVFKRRSLLALVVAAAGCRAIPAPEAEARGPDGQAATALLTDSMEYGVHLSGGMYTATIGFEYTNRSGAPVSRNYCRTPGPPALEKNVGGQWVRAYDPIELLCLTLPPFRVAAGEAYRGTLHFAAAPPGRNIFPRLEVDSIAGTYRLRWVLRAGDDPDARGAASVETISNQFRLVER